MRGALEWNDIPHKRDFRLPAPSSWVFCSFVNLIDVNWYKVTNLHRVTSHKCEGLLSTNHFLQGCCNIYFLRFHSEEFKTGRESGLDGRDVIPAYERNCFLLSGALLSTSRILFLHKQSYPSVQQIHQAALPIAPSLRLSAVVICIKPPYSLQLGARRRRRFIFLNMNLFKFVPHFHEWIPLTSPSNFLIDKYVKRFHS